jgi:CheY-like chemotaxis protein
MPRILIIDDNDELRRLLAEALTLAGYTVSEAVNGRAGIAQLRTGGVFEAVITDVVMPEADGAEVLAALRKRQPRPCVIVISGGGQIEPERYLQLARALGADEVLQKPFKPERLIEALGRLLKAAQPAPPA